MNSYNSNYRIICCYTAVACILVAGCSYSPPENAVITVITEHFEYRNFRVHEVRLGKITRLPISEREYMAPKTFVVEISSITLESMTDVGEPWNYKKGRKLVFSDASLRIRKGNITGKEWEIGIIKGIPVP